MKAIESEKKPKIGRKSLFGLVSIWMSYSLAVGMKDEIFLRRQNPFFIYIVWERRIGQGREERMEEKKMKPPL